MELPLPQGQLPAVGVAQQLAHAEPTGEQDNAARWYQCFCAAEPIEHRPCDRHQSERVAHWRHAVRAQQSLPPGRVRAGDAQLQQRALFHRIQAESAGAQQLAMGTPHRADAPQRGPQAVCRDDGAGGLAREYLFLYVGRGADEPQHRAAELCRQRHAPQLCPPSLRARQHHGERDVAAGGEQAERGNEPPERGGRGGGCDADAALLPRHQGGSNALRGAGHDDPSRDDGCRRGAGAGPQEQS